MCNVQCGSIVDSPLHTHSLLQTKKTYSDLEKVCEDARTKFTEAETRLRKKDLKFFESLASLEKNHKKYADRLKSCQKRTTVGRNDYILALDMTNQHLDRHSNKDLPHLMLVNLTELHMYMLHTQHTGRLNVHVRTLYIIRR